MVFYCSRPSGQRNGLAGTAGLEPADEGVKVPCLTTWRRPNGKENRGPGVTPIPSCLGWEMGLEPTTPGTTIRCSNQLSYTHHILRTSTGIHRRSRQEGVGTPEGTRTPGLLLRRQLLYPTELLAQIKSVERVTGIEPASPAWKAGALAIVLHPHGSSAKSSALICYHVSRPLSTG